jgi:DNA-binding IclR family transcriptional regulator
MTRLRTDDGEPQSLRDKLAQLFVDRPGMRLSVADIAEATGHSPSYTRKTLHLLKQGGYVKRVSTYQLK